MKKSTHFLSLRSTKQIQVKTASAAEPLTSRVAQNELKHESVLLHFTAYSFHRASPMSGYTLFLFKPNN